MASYSGGTLVGREASNPDGPLDGRKLQEIPLCNQCCNDAFLCNRNLCHTGELSSGIYNIHIYIYEDYKSTYILQRRHFIISQTKAVIFYTSQIVILTQLNYKLQRAYCGS
jgi:hypothetical protein